MNCQQAQDMMIAWVYDELPAEQIPDVRDHLATCDACRAEMADLRAARAAIAGALACEPAAPIADLPTQRTPTRWLRILAPLAAAAVLVAGIMLLLDIGTGPVAAASGPPVIERTDISLTVLSQPEGWQDAVGQPKRQYYYNKPPWRGLAMVRDRRLIRDLPEGVSRISFKDVPSGIRPDSVRLRSLTRPGGLCVLEQNYQYDLATADAVLKRYIDRDVTALAQDANADSVTGVLLSFDRRSLVIQPAGAGPRTLARAELQSICLAKLPDGLRSTPTLQWELENRDESRQNFEVAYLTEGLSWRADYVLKLARLDIAPDANEDGGVPAILDAADLVGYATVRNHSGVTFANAQLKLLAGDVNLIPPETVITVLRSKWSEADEGSSLTHAAMTEKAFFEHHLYTVSRPTTLRDRETKQIEMVSGQDVGLTRGYVYTAGDKISAPRVVSEMVNSEANGLGKPLPKGVMRLYAPGPDGETTYVAQTTIDHTPKDEKLRLQWGHAFDIACSATETNHRRSGSDHTHTCRVDLRNHKDRDVTVTVRVRVPASTYRFECKGFDWRVREVGIVEITVPAAANHPASALYTFQYDPLSGGGLKSPHDQ